MTKYEIESRIVLLKVLVILNTVMYLFTKSNLILINALLGLGLIWALSKVEASDE